jgi:hypothetical protein
VDSLKTAKEMREGRGSAKAVDSLKTAKEMREGRGSAKAVDSLKTAKEMREGRGSAKAVDSLKTAKEIREGRGSAKAVDSLKTDKRKYVIRSTLNFTQTDDVMRQRVREALTATTEAVMIEVTAPEVTVKEQFQIGPETDIVVYNFSPQDNNQVSVSYELRGGKEDALRDVFDWSGKFQRHDFRKTYAGKATAQARGKGMGIVMPYKDGDRINTFSKAQRETPIRLNYNSSKRKGDVD